MFGEFSLEFRSTSLWLCPLPPPLPIISTTFITFTWWYLWILCWRRCTATISLLMYVHFSKCWATRINMYKQFDGYSSNYDRMLCKKVFVISLQKLNCHSLVTYISWLVSRAKCLSIFTQKMYHATVLHSIIAFKLLIKQPKGDLMHRLSALWVSSW